MGLYQIEHLIRCPRQRMIQCLAGCLAHCGFDRVRRQPKPGIHKAHIAPRAAMTDFMRFKKGDARAFVQHLGPQNTR